MVGLQGILMDYKYLANVFVRVVDSTCVISLLFHNVTSSFVSITLRTGLHDQYVMVVSAGTRPAPEGRQPIWSRTCTFDMKYNGQ